jgi:hypothetical protein
MVCCVGLTSDKEGRQAQQQEQEQEQEQQEIKSDS